MLVSAISVSMSFSLIKINGMIARVVVKIYRIDKSLFFFFISEDSLFVELKELRDILFTFALQD